jgi:hypothetical protein
VFELHQHILRSEGNELLLDNFLFYSSLGNSFFLIKFMKSSVPAFHVKRVLLTVQGNYFLELFLGKFKWQFWIPFKTVFLKKYLIFSKNYFLYFLDYFYVLISKIILKIKKIILIYFQENNILKSICYYIFKYFLNLFIWFNITSDLYFDVNKNIYISNFSPDFAFTKKLIFYRFFYSTIVIIFILVYAVFLDDFKNKSFIILSYI